MISLIEFSILMRHAYHQNILPPSVVGPNGTTNPAITSARVGTTIVISACNVISQSAPQLFVFKDKRAVNDLLKGVLSGTGCTMSAIGWFKSMIFHDYFESYLSKHIQGGVGTDYYLHIYDRNTSHVNVPLIKWAKSNILFVLSAHSSHLLQPLDVSVLKPFKTAYNKECQSFKRSYVRRQTSRYDKCSLTCKAYPKALTPSNIVSAFQMTGI